MTALESLLLLSLLAADPLGPGDHTRTLKVGELERNYIFHIPSKYKQDTPTPVVLVYHGGGSNAEVMVQFSRMNTKADDVGFKGGKGKGVSGTEFYSVEHSIQAWVKANGCNDEPVVTKQQPKVADGTTIIRKTYAGGKEGSEVVLIEIGGGGHTWPGEPSRTRFLGKTTMNISANDAMWEFFRKHPMQ